MEEARGEEGGERRTPHQKKRPHPRARARRDMARHAALRVGWSRKGGARVLMTMPRVDTATAQLPKDDGGPQSCAVAPFARCLPCHAAARGAICLLSDDTAEGERRRESSILCASLAHLRRSGAIVIARRAEQSNSRAGALGALALADSTLGDGLAAARARAPDPTIGSLPLAARSSQLVKSPYPSCPSRRRWGRSRR